MNDTRQNGISTKEIQILIVDDDITVRYLMNEFMETLGYQSQMVDSGEKALEFLKANFVDVVITDIMMPGMDGLELTERIRGEYDSEIIVMTGFAGEYSYEEVIRKGATDFVFKPVRFEELKLRLERVLKERHLKQQLKRLAITDNLTQLYNSRFFYEQLAIEIERCNRYQHHLSLLFIDIDYFKKFNDRYGHLEGDKVLAYIGQAIQSSLRRLDSAYRYGGEEFTVLLPETDGAKARHVAERIAKVARSKTFTFTESDSANVTVSIGIAEYAPEEDMRSFIKRADMAMFNSKQKGRNRITFHPAPDAPASSCKKS